MPPTINPAQISMVKVCEYCASVGVKTPVAGSSILNQLPATVVGQWAASDGANVIVKLDAGGTPLLARITRRSRDLLALEPGTLVWAHVKASTLLPIL